VAKKWEIKSLFSYLPKVIDNILVASRTPCCWPRIGSSLHPTISSVYSDSVWLKVRDTEFVFFFTGNRLLYCIKLLPCVMLLLTSLQRSILKQKKCLQYSYTGLLWSLIYSFRSIGQTIRWNILVRKLNTTSNDCKFKYM